MRSNSYIVLGASVGTTGTRWLMILGLLAAVVVAAVATVDDGAVDSGVGVDFVDGGSGGVTGVYTSTFVFFVGGTAGNELLASSSTTAAGADTVTGDNEAAAIFFSISRTSCATLVRSRRSESSYCKNVRNKKNVRI